MFFHLFFIHLTSGKFREFPDSLKIDKIKARVLGPGFIYNIYNQIIGSYSA